MGMKNSYAANSWRNARQPEVVEGDRPELMYKLADNIVTTIPALLDWAAR